MLKLLERNCYMASLDLKDAYYSVAVQPSHRKYLRFMWNNILYQFTCLPNGLSPCQRKFTKLLKPPLATLHKQGHVLSSYIDDLFVLARTYGRCVTNVPNHPDKSVFIPSQRLVLLGFIIDSVAMTITLTPEKAFSVKEACSSLLEGVTTIREVARVIGKVISSFPGVICGPLHYRSLEHDKTRALQSCMGNFDCPMSLSEDSYRELDWWIKHIDQSFNVISPRQPLQLSPTMRLAPVGEQYLELLAQGVLGLPEKNPFTLIIWNS